MNFKKSFVIVALFIVTLALVMVGLIILSSASAALLIRGGPDQNLYIHLGKQLIWLALGLGLMGLATQFDYNLLRPLARPFLLFNMVLLAAVLWSPLGYTINSARRWLDLGFIHIQPSELAKLTMILYLAESWSRKYEDLEDFWRGVVPTFTVIGVILAMIFPQPDKGTAFFLGSLCVMLWFIAGGNVRRILPILCILLAVTLLLIASDDYSRRRITGFLFGESDHIRMSKVAFANGSWSGVGVGQSRQAMGFLPEPNTDFIFAVYAEELGFVGCILMLSAFATIVLISVYVALKCDDLFGSLVSAGCGLCIGFQAFLNIAVVTKVVPTKGISLPFISYGGSSLAVFMVMVGLIMNVAGSTLRGDVSDRTTYPKRRRQSSAELHPLSI
ncbi:MAG TPA: putative peptidoglycan glycosyltransferase FtsW [bacterium]|nr:putative peptidoglycan glycosyltransferase FtsW [bacterium]HQO33398.1 putative peptidoglycan glycosyltransferase FtsW [bacterium]HQP98635.1 putative peptidoglycan glycosyltransferase FtsW [bacterium]